MVKSEKPNPDNEETVKQVTENFSKKTLVPAFEKEPDIKLSEINQDIVLNDVEKEKVDDICPHYQILKDRYHEYRNPDPEGKNPDGFPLKIDRRHELAPFEAVLSQAVLTTLRVTPNRLIKCFVYEVDPQTGKEERKTKMIVDKEVQGDRLDGSPSTIANIRVGYYKYPMQFQQDLDGDWTPINNKFKKVWYLDWDSKKAEQIALSGNPYTKKYVVWHPDPNLPISKKEYRRENFFDMTDEEQIKDIENLPKNKQLK